MTSKTEQLDALFSEWENTVSEYKSCFVKDGIINEDLYKAASRKILFITKEPNNPDKEEGDYRAWWKEGLKYTFSHRIAEWSYGLLNNFPAYDKMFEEKSSTQNAIQQIAFMNIKKCGGGGNAVYGDMIEHAKTNSKFLNRQIEIISPDIIITGTSWSELRNELFPNTKWRDSGYAIEIGRHNNAKVIDFYHPSSRTPPSASYSLLQNIISSDKFKDL